MMFHSAFLYEKGDCYVQIYCEENFANDSDIDCRNDCRIYVCAFNSR